MGNVIRYICAIIGLLASVPSIAFASVSCTVTGSIAVNMPAVLTAPRDRSLGTPLSAWSNSGLIKVASGCTATNTSSVYMQARGALAPSGKSVVIDGRDHPIFESGLPGVGLIMAAKDRNGPWKSIYATPTDIIKAWATNWDIEVSVRLIATGAPIVTGSVGAMTVGEVFLVEKSSGSTSAAAPIKMSSTSVTAQTCSVNAGSVNIPVNLGTISAPGLAGPVGTIAGNASFSVRLNCSAGMNVYMTLTDGNNLGNTSDTLSLSPSPTMARGVGIQVRRNGTPVRFGPDSSLAGNANQFAIGASPNGALDVPFTANYIKTEVAVAPGDANAVATYTLSYQ
ncbi:fimbrial protein [Pseudomonas denitrificans (nom. rej.)]|nr:fimbrial protein [Pseudomonas denitrificans (nom. rej.)]